MIRLLVPWISWNVLSLLVSQMAVFYAPNKVFFCYKMFTENTTLQHGWQFIIVIQLLEYAIPPPPLSVHYTDIWYYLPGLIFFYDSMRLYFQEMTTIPDLFSTVISVYCILCVVSYFQVSQSSSSFSYTSKKQESLESRLHMDWHDHHDDHQELTAQPPSSRQDRHPVWNECGLWMASQSSPSSLT